LDFGHFGFGTFFLKNMDFFERKHWTLLKSKTILKNSGLISFKNVGPFLIVGFFL